MTSRSGASPRRVSLKRKALEDYRELVGDDLVAEVRALGAALRGMRVLELSATATGGGVAELLPSLVPVERDLGIEAEWRVIVGDPVFFEVTERLHKGMQGMAVEPGDVDYREYLSHNLATPPPSTREAPGTSSSCTIPSPPRSARTSGSGPVAGSGGATSLVNARPRGLGLPAAVLEQHDLAVFTLGSFVPPDLALPTELVVPAIDPLTSKNQELPAYLARRTVAALGVDLSRPLLLQVSRFDRWKDPLGVVEVWRRVRQTFPSVQLALVGSMATDDPEGWRVYGEIELETAAEPACLLFTDQMGVASHEVNAFQRVADVAIQKSIREGFGLVVAETLWKGTAMVAGRAGGIPVQLGDGVGGYLAGSVDEFAERTVRLLEDPVAARAVGAAGAERMRERFLLPRLLHDHLAVLRRLAA